MRSYLLATCLLLAAVPACAGSTRTRERDAMVVALSRAERDRTHDLAGDVGLGAVLERRALVMAVLARNPDLDAARETWRAALAAVPSSTAMPDPMASYDIAPFRIGSDRLSQTISVSQKLPYPGKRGLAGDAAVAEAEAAQADYAALRLALAEAAINAFDDDYLAARALEVNVHHRDLLERIEKSATAQYTVGRASQQDPLEARAAIISLDRERLQIETQQRAAIAKINRLLRRRVDAELPPPPARLDAAPRSAPPSALHPRLVAAQARVRARGSDIALAERAFYPDFEVRAAYDAFWEVWQDQWIIGVGIEIPLQRDKRHADVERARAEQARAVAELASASDMLDEERDRARREVDEATRTLALYETQLVPTERARVDAALAGFSAGQNPFSVVVMAEHALRTTELALEQARAELDRRIAALDRVDGRIPGGGQ
jgi:outer membrane protein TolC